MFEKFCDLREKNAQFHNISVQKNSLCLFSAFFSFGSQLFFQLRIQPKSVQNASFEEFQILKVFTKWCSEKVGLKVKLT